MFYFGLAVIIIGIIIVITITRDFSPYSEFYRPLGHGYHHRDLPNSIDWVDFAVVGGKPGSYKETTVK